MTIDQSFVLCYPYQFVTSHEVLLSWAGIFSIWNPPQFSEEISLVSQGSALAWLCPNHQLNANLFRLIVNWQYYHETIWLYIAKSLVFDFAKFSCGYSFK